MSLKPVVLVVQLLSLPVSVYTLPNFSGLGSTKTCDGSTVVQDLRAGGVNEQTSVISIRQKRVKVCMPAPASRTWHRGEEGVTE